jgi:hypothetical protein
VNNGTAWRENSATRLRWAVNLQRAWRAKQRSLRDALEQMEATRHDIVKARRRAEDLPRGEMRDRQLGSLDLFMAEWTRSYEAFGRRLQRVNTHIVPRSRKG